MKILAVSDNVLPQLENADYLRRSYADVEMVISCGDMPAPYIDFIVSVLDVPLFYVRGNHDTEYTSGNPGGENLHRRAVFFKGLWFAGLEGSMLYNGGKAQYGDFQMTQMVLAFASGMLWRRARRGYGLDVLVTHSPPKGIHDLPDKTHTGFRALRWFMRWYRPRYLIHGHVDTWDRRKTTVTQFEHSEVININPVKVLTIDQLTTHQQSRDQQSRPKQAR